jgi:hypothetical protein
MVGKGQDKVLFKRSYVRETGHHYLRQMLADEQFERPESCRQETLS